MVKEKKMFVTGYLILKENIRFFVGIVMSGEVVVYAFL